jgi:hypothetical protein
MQKLTIRAASPQSARAMLEALSEFQVEFAEADGARELTVTLRQGDGEIVAVLHALAQYVTERETGPARISLEGRDYTMHPDAAA